MTQTLKTTSAKCKCDGTKHFRIATIRTKNAVAAKQPKQCVECHTLLCTHHNFNLRGCMATKDHTGPHINYTSPSETWTDVDGRYIDSKEIWVALVDRFAPQGRGAPAP